MSVTDINNTREVLSKLIELNNKLSERNAIQNKLEEEATDMPVMKALFEKYYSMHTGLTDIPSVFSNFPQFPLDKEHYEKYEVAAQKAFKLDKILIAAIIGCAILSLIIDTFGALLVIVIVGSIIIWSLNSDKKVKYKKAKEEYELSLERYNTTYASFRQALEVYPQEKSTGIQSAVKYGQYYKEIQTEFLQKIEEFNKELEDMQIKLDSMTSSIAEEYDFITERYYHLVPDIIDILKNHRAETYKDALNLAIADEEAEQKRQFEEEMEYERQQREEEMARQQMLQMEEMRRHNAEMERQQAVANELAAQAQREAQRQRRADEAQAMRDRSQAEKAASQRCSTCRNYHRGCRGGVINCGAYVSNRI